jgi:hypothetical protein
MTCFIGNERSKNVLEEIIKQFLEERMTMIGYYEKNKIGHNSLIEALQKISEQYASILENIK